MSSIYLLLLALVLLSLLNLYILLFHRRKESRTDNLNELQNAFNSFEHYNREEISKLRTELLNISAENRKELNESIRAQNEVLIQQSTTSREELNNSFNALKQQFNNDAATNREELKKALNDLSDNFSRKMTELINIQQQEAENSRKTLESKMEQIRQSNETKLEQMRQTVDEKLHDTLEKRLGESFKQVSERLELVHKSMGEMQNLANGVGDLKKALTNVKTRGVLGEIQLENLLEEMLTPEQYEKNFRPNKNRDEKVEFAIRLPGKSDEQDFVYLPIDAKFPIEDYYRILDAYDLGDLASVENAQKSLVQKIKNCAKDIRDKYINPPITTDFGMLFLPFEGLYAEVLRNTGLFETIMRDYQVIICGPTTTAAVINSLQVGFRTLAIQKKSSEVWKILASIKQEFGKFGTLLDQTQKKLQEASNTIEKASHRSRQIEKRLRKVQELPVQETEQIMDV
ncbi:MAG: DNA recombination protein RmuC [Candidatus Cloacimonetes bacterium]|jgi:DNA recombination protein RmuC|nr:DNA recombination protein RmuC [Candidatus Cloacimonas sp.]MDD2250497.1 DNA recombination protein RmuC [Candidatus Cloacimonadota bacterium]MCK9164813.1 DNA recombination protein RmuC [Candidatus Cloacimonas sp.]MDD3734147.1 DNA recombination protein RmuC [Candidatus Cloacimonadota bacterium]MDD4676706.1 DNA recombination protein RmuC [Candidatus Cloacimonadota bacterium]